MRRFLSVLTLLVAVTSVQAQELKLKLTLTINGTSWPKPLYLGYDPIAVDSFYKPGKWPMPEYPEGEVEVPSDAFGDVDFRFGGTTIGRPNLGDGCYIDIQPKPGVDSFQMRFQVNLTATNATSATITWDSSALPAIIKHLYLAEASKPNAPRLDMTQVGRFDIPLDSLHLGKYRQIALTLLYNQEALGVRGLQRSTSLLIFPTVLTNVEGLRVSAPGEYTVDCRIIDLLGRVVSVTTASLFEGVQRLPLDISGLASGTYIVELREPTKNELTRQQIIIQ